MDILRCLARFLDRPSFPWKRLIMGFSVGQYLFEGFLSFRQYQYLKAPAAPKVLQHEVSQEVFDKSQAYGRAKAKFGFYDGIWNQMQNLAFFQFDLLPKLWSWSGKLLLRWAPVAFSGEISHSIVFVLSTILLNQILSLPSSVYHTFVLEAKFGFNKQTPQLFITDLIKTQLLTFTMVPPILAAFTAIVRRSGDGFFYYLWLFGAGLQVFMITIYPIVILPLFNKLSPLEEGQLKTDVEDLAKKLTFPLHELYVIDGSRRSAHSNAYFFGLPWKKHIVIYDTLIAKSETQEVVAVLAHELGHWSLGHTTRLFAISQAHFFYIFALFSVFINNKSLYADFGFFNERPMIIGFLLFSDALAPMDMVIKLLMNVLSRRYEFQADAFARGLGYSEDLARSLIKLQIQNLSTMDADWMYANYHFSHPILTERLKAIDWHPTGKIVSEEATKEATKEDASTAKATGRDELVGAQFAVMNVSLARPTVFGATMRLTASMANPFLSSSSPTAGILAQRLPLAGASRSAAQSQMRSFSVLPQLRPTMMSGYAVFRLASAPSALTPFSPSASSSVSATLDLVAPTSISRHPALAGFGSQLRCGPRATMERTSRLIQKRRHGFLSRIRTKNGRKTLQRRRAKGRKRLSY
ncbi:prenyl protease ste24 [Grosmannia clavigera kw1407]|uniref:Ste24 endopeptidase n=1 Tax=Grosmannia clavigera (strain kw1407 / UAMH 11150) TaxID=655863 RepID=F0XEG0_GROCL|nr:prenyl protease ste24 [Grosmannia clavigera kw1407]EFX04750.1 prenyl protease ste24 [Grosmannia clavigera kw1407]